MYLRLVPDFTSEGGGVSPPGTGRPSPNYVKALMSASRCIDDVLLLPQVRRAV